MKPDEKYFDMIDSLIAGRRGIVIRGMPGSACLATAFGYIAHKHGLYGGERAQDFDEAMRRMNEYDVGRYLTFHWYMARYQREYYEAFETAKDYPFIMYFCKDTWYKDITLLLDMAAHMPSKKAYLVYFEHPWPDEERISWSKKYGVRFSSQPQNRFEQRIYTAPPNLYLINVCIDDSEEDMDEYHAGDGGAKTRASELARARARREDIFPALTVKRDPRSIVNADIRRLYFIIDDFISANAEFGFDKDGRPCAIPRLRNYYRLGEAYFLSYETIDDAAEGVLDVLYRRMRDRMSFGNRMVSIQDRLMTKLKKIIEAEFNLSLDSWPHS